MSTRQKWTLILTPPLLGLALALCLILIPRPRPQYGGWMVLEVSTNGTNWEVNKKIWVGIPTVADTNGLMRLWRITNSSAP